MKVVSLAPIALFFGTVAYLLYNLMSEGMQKYSPIRKAYQASLLGFYQHYTCGLIPWFRVLGGIAGFCLMALFALLLLNLEHQQYLLVLKVSGIFLLLQFNALLGFIGVCIYHCKAERKFKRKFKHFISPFGVFTCGLRELHTAFTKGNYSFVAIFVIGWLLFMFGGVFILFLLPMD